MGWFSEDAYTCSECTYMDPSNMDSNKMYYCEKKYERVSPCAAACDGFTKAYSRRDAESKSLRENSTSSSSGCFITTIVCNILGYADNVSYLKALRYFRNEVLQKDEKFKSLLATYDVVGPIISKKLEQDENKKKIYLNLFNLCIKKVCKLVELKKDDEAIELYKDMTNLLIQGYGINETYSEDYLNNMDITKSGHGRVAVLKNN